MDMRDDPVLDNGANSTQDQRAIPTVEFASETVNKSDDGKSATDATPFEDNSASTDESSEDVLDKLRSEVQRRLDAVIEGEKQLRERIKEVNRSITPILKQIDGLKQSLRLDKAPLADLRRKAVKVAEQQTAEMKVLGHGLAWEAQLRTDLADAGLLRLQHLQQVTIEMANDWDRNGEEWNHAIREELSNRNATVSEDEKRWLQKVKSDGVPVAEASEARLQSADSASSEGDSPIDSTVIFDAAGEAAP